MSALLDGRVIIVTGAARGIGQAYAKALAEAGATVVAADILDCGETIGLLGGRGTGVPLDVTDMASCSAMAEATLAAYGRIDGIINNAAMFGPSAHTEGARMLAFDEIDEDAWQRMMNINVTGTWRACKAVVPAMRKQGYGKIVNISSNTIQLGNPNLLHHDALSGARTRARRHPREHAGAGLHPEPGEQGHHAREPRRGHHRRHESHLFAGPRAVRRRPGRHRRVPVLGAVGLRVRADDLGRRRRLFHRHVRSPAP
jgi:3-oxoacyl-[acyl-carrier protein] reductase